jgi:hypothetical protein
MTDAQLNKEWRAIVINALNEIKSDVKEIKIETKQTNGRVTALEVKHSLCPIAKLQQDFNDFEDDLEPIKILAIQQGNLEKEIGIVKEDIKEINKVIGIFSFVYKNPKLTKIIIYFMLTMLGYNTLINILTKINVI